MTGSITCFFTCGAEIFGGNGFVMLSGNHHGVHAVRLAVHILDADLALAIGTEKIQLAGTAYFAELTNQFVRQHDRERHQFRGFIAGIAEHEALIAGAAGIDAHRNIGGLALNGVQNPAGFAIEPKCRVGITDIADHFARQARHIDISISRDFAGNDSTFR